MERDWLAAGDVSRGIVNVVELRPGVDAVAARVRVAAQLHPRRGLPGVFELDAAAIASIDVAPEQRTDRRQLARRGDLVAELHRVHIGVYRRRCAAIVPAGFEIEQALRADGVQV